MWSCEGVLNIDLVRLTLIGQFLAHWIVALSTICTVVARSYAKSAFVEAFFLLKSDNVLDLPGDLCPFGK